MNEKALKYSKIQRRQNQHNMQEGITLRAGD